MKEVHPPYDLITCFSVGLRPAGSSVQDVISVHSPMDALFIQGRCWGLRVHTEGVTSRHFGLFWFRLRVWFCGSWVTWKLYLSWLRIRGVWGEVRGCMEDQVGLVLVPVYLTWCIMMWRLLLYLAGIYIRSLPSVLHLFTCQSQHETTSCLVLPLPDNCSS